jgi:hypothetical protein
MDHEQLIENYEQWLKTDNGRLDNEEAERKTVSRLTEQNIQDAAADKFRKDDKLRKKAKETKSTDKEILGQDVADDEAEAAADGDEHGGVIGAEGAGESSDDEGSTGEGVGDKQTRGRRDSASQELCIHFKLFPGYSRRTTECGASKVLCH